MSKETTLWEPNYALCRPWIEQIREASAHVHVLSLEQIMALPSGIGSNAAIYFFWLEGKLQYIGKSRSLKKRMRDHRRDGRIRHDRCTLLELPAADEVLRDHERAYIAAYPTPFNSRDYTPGT
jgi:hypothetical protein